MIALGYKNHKSCKILPKFLSNLHFSQESYKFVQESQTLQICYNVEHFVQDSDTIFAKNAFLTRNSYKKCDVLFRPKFQKSSNYQQQQPQLPFTMYKLSQDPSKKVRNVNFEQEDFTCNLTPKITITYSSYETPDKNSENSSANDDRNMNIVPNENTFQGLSNGQVLSGTVMEKISKNTTKPPVQCHIQNYKNLENSSQIQPLVSILPQPISTTQGTAENGGQCSLRGYDTSQRCNVVSQSFTTITSNNVFRGSSKATTGKLKKEFERRELMKLKDKVQTIVIWVLTQPKRSIFENVYWWCVW